MAQIKDILIINDHTLRLNQDAKKGDEIDLKSLNSVDLAPIQKMIDEKRDQVYNQRLKALEHNLVLEKTRDIQNAVQTRDNQIIALKENLKSLEENLKVRIASDYKETISDLKHKIVLLENKQESLIDSKEKEIALRVSEQVSDAKEKLMTYQHEINRLKQEISSKDQMYTLQKEYAIQNKEKEMNERIQEKEAIISRLSLEKSNLNIKKMGEALETWIDEEFQNHALNGLDTCRWYKDNESIKGHGESRGTKADYIFKVYPTSDFVEEDILTSVACEIKSEDPNSTYKKKNADHYDKLNKDREKKHCEFALLISELEWDSPNDAPIRKVQAYDKMYMVRPPYFMVFLNILTAITLRYKDAISDYQIERKKFKDIEDIQSEFEHMKDDILDKTIDYIQKKMDDIVKSADNIKLEANKILEASRVVMESHLSTVIRKIKNFKIHQIIDQINALSQNE